MCGGRLWRARGPAAPRGWSGTSRCSSAYKRAQSLYTDVIRTAVALAPGSRPNWQCAAPSRVADPSRTQGSRRAAGPARSADALADRGGLPALAPHPAQVALTPNGTRDNPMPTESPLRQQRFSPQRPPFDRRVCLPCAQLSGNVPPIWRGPPDAASASAFAATSTTSAPEVTCD